MTDARAADLIKMAAQPSRVRIITLLSDEPNGEAHVGALRTAAKMGQPAVSHHLALMRHAGVVSQRRRGKFNYYSLTEVGLALAAAVRALRGGPDREPGA